MSDAGHRAKERNVKITLDDLIQMDIAPDVGLPILKPKAHIVPERISNICCLCASQRASMPAHARFADAGERDL